MNSTAFLLLAMTLAVATGDWLAVASGRKALEYLAKPLTMVMLIGVALSLDVHRDVVLGAFVVALIFSLIGDVFLMLPGGQWFIFGLGAFLAAHVAYVVGLVISGVTLAGLALGAAVVVIGVLMIGVRIVSGVRRQEPSMAGPVMGYLVVISLMVVCAFGTRNLWAIGGAALFYTSDALIAWNRFVKDHSWRNVVVMITYHLGQIGLVLFLV
jgi:uncharacterized membrane protein YhhN